MRELFLSVLCLALSCRAAAPETGANRLREIVRLPTMDLGFSLTFQSRQGWTLTVGGLEEDTAAEIAGLRKELKGEASDAERYSRLSELYGRADDRTNSQAAADRAVELFRQQTQLQSESGPLLAALGDALSRAQKNEEAEAVLRRATRVAPGQWKCWIELGLFLDENAWRALTPDSMNVGKNPLTDILANRPSANRVKEVESLFDEAGQCFNKAVATAPEEARVFFERAVHKSIHSVVKAQLRALRGGTSGPPDSIYGSMFSPDCISDFREAARLSPNDCAAIGGCAFFEAMSYAIQQGATRSGEDLWHLLPEENQRSVQDMLNRLEMLSREANPRTAVGALEVLAVTRAMIHGDFGSGIADLRRAHALDVSRDQTWELLAIFYVNLGKLEELLPICEKRAKAKDSVHNRIWLAKVCEKLKKAGKAEEHVRIILKKEPNNVWADLALASLLLKRGTEESVLREAERVLERTKPLLEKADTPDGRDLRIHYSLSVAVLYGLTDGKDAALGEVRKVLEEDKDNEYAKQILAALGQ